MSLFTRTSGLFRQPKWQTFDSLFVPSVPHRSNGFFGLYAMGRSPGCQSTMRKGNHRDAVTLTASRLRRHSRQRRARTSRKPPSHYARLSQKYPNVPDKPISSHLDLACPRLTGKVSSVLSSMNKKLNWWFPLERAVFLVRHGSIFGLIYSVFYSGAAYGISSYVTFEEAAVRLALSNYVKVDDMDKVVIISENDTVWFPRTKGQLIPSVGKKIVSAGRQHANQKLAEISEKSRAYAGTPFEPLLEEEMKLWSQAVRTMGGIDSSTGSPKHWKFVVFPLRVPQAFVTCICPRHIFISTGMLELVDSTDELSVIIGHELAHVILSHVADGEEKNAGLYAVQVFLLAADPTRGMISLAFMGGIQWIRKALGARDSRRMESEADDLGLILASNASYDTSAGTEIMRKMHETFECQDEEWVLRKQFRETFSTHPPMIERYRILKEKSKELQSRKE